ncbi:MAG: ATPase, T2SS/T4P/T4SS family [Phycisphaerales bacterium]
MPTYRLTCNNPDVGIIELRSEPVAFGRHPDNDVSIRDDVASRFHCVVEPDSDHGFRLKDLGSRNGTKLNGQRISEVLISEGDCISIGRHEFTVELESSKKERRRKARERGQASDPSWAIDLRELIDSLPPKTSVDEAVVLIEADGSPSGALENDSDGSRSTRLLLLAASKARATDLHWEPKGDIFQVRMRVDGQMINVVEFPNSVGEVSIGLIRNACQMKQAARDAVQDGHFAARFQDRRVDFRVSLTPTVHGQKLVVRILDSRQAPRTLADLQLPGYMHQHVQKVCEQDAGLLLVSGPTGSGKTTTLYNCLREIDRDRRNVVTIEDPVEYYIDSVTQIPVKENGGFGQLLRSVLRQDPDVILVGEIRDDETARVAMQAAMTGHVVFSTVHAKDTIGSIFRLLDLGVEPYLVANSLEIVMAQRLVRTLCETCKRAAPVSPGQATRMGRYLEGKTKVYAATGCARCLRTGYRGRRALFELLPFNDELRDCILSSPSIHAIKKIIEQGAFTTLQQYGYILAARGITSLEEVERVSGSY